MYQVLAEVINNYSVNFSEEWKGSNIHTIINYSSITITTKYQTAIHNHA